MKLSRFFLTFLSTLAIVFFVFASPIGYVRADDEIKVPKPLQLQVPIGSYDKVTLCKKDDSGNLICNGIAEMFAAVYVWIITAAAIMAVVVLMAGGMRWLTSGGNKGGVDAAKKMISNAVVGLALLLGSYTLLYLINPNLTAFKSLSLTQVKNEQKLVVTQISTENTAGDLTSSDYSASISPTNVPLYKQWDPRWASNAYGACSAPSTIASSGCGPTSAAMVLSAYGHTITPPQMAALFANNGFRACGNGTAYGAFTTSTVMGSLGFKGEAISKDQTTITNYLKNNQPIIVTVGPSIFTGGGHFIVLAGLDINGNFLVNDPNKSSYTGLGATNSIPPRYIIPNIAAAFYVRPTNGGSITAPAK